MLGPPSSDWYQQPALCHLDSAYNLARWLVQDDTQAQEAVAHACTEAFASLDRGQEEGARVRLLASVRRACISQTDRARDEAPTEPRAGMDEAREPAGSGSTARTPIDAALQHLPFQLREVIVLREMEQLSYREIALIADVPIDAVTSRLAHARALLARELDLKVAASSAV